EELYELTSAVLDEVRTGYYANTGDVNGSGSVDTADALLAMRYAMNLAELTPGAVTRGDINLDGRLDTADSMLIMRIGLGM
ncbi:MAG: dockerin type I repeat-containing protein, partial [Clostridia bacterium]|nr:dockerin type I repeat-containing protein [Clostridia bacterium]